MKNKKKRKERTKKKERKKEKEQGDCDGNYQLPKHISEGNNYSSNVHRNLKEKCEKDNKSSIFKLIFNKNYNILKIYMGSMMLLEITAF